MFLFDVAGQALKIFKQLIVNFSSLHILKIEKSMEQAPFLYLFPELILYQHIFSYKVHSCNGLFDLLVGTAKVRLSGCSHCLRNRCINMSVSLRNGFMKRYCQILHAARVRLKEMSHYL